MNNALLVRGIECLSDLLGNHQALVDGQRSMDDPIRQRRSVDELEDYARCGRRFLEAVDRADVGMIERGEDFGLALQAGDAIGILRECGGRILIATSRFRRVSRARYTSPMPPSPSFARI